MHRRRITIVTTEQAWLAIILSYKYPCRLTNSILTNEK